MNRKIQMKIRLWSLVTEMYPTWKYKTTYATYQNAIVIIKLFLLSNFFIFNFDST